MTGDPRHRRSQLVDSMTLVEVPERAIRRITGLLVLCLGAIGVVSTLSQDGPPTGWQSAVVGAVCATTIPVGLFIARTPVNLGWRRQQTPRGKTLTIAFVAYADLGIGAVLLTFSDREGALYGTALFAIIGVYAGYFAPRRYVTAHIVYTSIFITALAWLTWRQGGHDAAGIAARWMVSILSANCAMGLLHNFTNGVQKALDTQLDNAIRDPLTGLLNRRGLESWAEWTLLNQRDPIAFVVLDLDHFKAVNDEHGHSAGDSVLVLVGTRLRGILGEEATIARTGGEEFALVLPEDLENSLLIADRIRLEVHHPDDAIPVTVSVGVAVLPNVTSLRSDPVTALNEGLRRADTALFHAKHAGRNQVRRLPPTNPE